MATDRRLLLLRALAEAAGYEMHIGALHLVLEYKGHHVSRDLVQTDLAWLQEQNLVQLRDIAKVQIATLTQRGLDVSAGRATVPGVRRPGLDD